MTEPIPRMKAKTKAFADKLLSDPKTSPTQAYLDTHKTESRKTATVEASKTLRKPNVVIYMKEHISLAKQTNVSILQNAQDKLDSPTWQRLASDVSERILDRELGKATQRSETSSVNYNLNVEADKAMGDAFTAFLSGSTTQT